MTLPTERYRAVVAAGRLMRDLLDPKETPKVPRAIRQRAFRVLRHYPWDGELDMAAEKAPEVFHK